MKKKILIVDDDATLASEAKLTLEETGRFDVHYETKAACALKAAQMYKPDLILMDLLMPDMSGAEVSHQLRQDPKTTEIPIVFFTVLVSREEVLENSKMIGGHYFIAKPSTADEIIECIDRALAYRKTHSPA